MILDLPLKTSASTMDGGIAAVSGIGQYELLTVGGVWLAGDKFTILLTETATGRQVQLGAGNVTGITPTYCFTYNDKVYVLAGATLYFSAIGAPTTFNDPDGVGNGFVQVTNHFSTPEDLTTIAAFQGRIVLFSRQGLQIWTVPADPTAWELNQVFEFIGSRSPLSVKTTGDFEVIFLDETGIRSLRARETTLNAFSEDLGSPIDEVVQSALIGSSEGQKNAANAIVEPASKRYWLFLKDTIYVLSNFPGSKVLAWSKYSPTYELGGVQTTFQPEKFVTFKGRVYCRAADNGLYLYGGTDNNTFDNVVASWVTPWLDGKTPGNRKASKSIDIAQSGGWKLEAGMDPISGTLTEIYNDSQSSFDLGTVPYSDRGTHFRLKGTTTGSTAAKVGMVLFKYEEGDEV